MDRTKMKTVLLPLSIFAEQLNLTGLDPALTEGNGKEQCSQLDRLSQPRQGSAACGWPHRAGLCSWGAVIGGHTVAFVVHTCNAASEFIPRVSGRTSLLCP